MFKKVLEKNVFALLCLVYLGIPHITAAKNISVIFIPLDNRPVCSGYARQSLQSANCTVILPPEKLLASHDLPGDPEALLDWLERTAPRADAAVISTDSLIYGGLVASRTHNTPESVLRKRIKRISVLKTFLPIKLYTFSTIMRTPQSSRGKVEPPYYEKLGPLIFAYSALIDKEDQKRLAPSESLTKQTLEENLPKAVLEDWLARRTTNLNINFELARMVTNNRFHYLAVGKDDNAPLSATHMEARKLNLENFNTDPHAFQIIDGVDQLGLLLLTRAYNEINNTAPAIHILYSPGQGAKTLPQYSDSFLQDSIPRQIRTAGAVIAENISDADLVLAVNAPENGIVKDSTADDNQFFPSSANKEFTKQLTELLNKGVSVSLADISYSNGADNGFMHYFTVNSHPEKLKAYNGWNTADNAVGYAIAQGILAKHTPSDKLAAQLKQRFIDDWFYQSNARKKIADKLSQNNRSHIKYDLGSHSGEILRQVTDDCRDLVLRYDYTRKTKFELSFPWHRLFEVEVKLKEK